MKKMHFGMQIENKIYGEIDTMYTYKYANFFTDGTFIQTDAVIDLYNTKHNTSIRKKKAAGSVSFVDTLPGTVLTGSEIADSLSAVTEQKSTWDSILPKLPSTQPKEIVKEQTSTAKLVQLIAELEKLEAENISLLAENEALKQQVKENITKEEVKVPKQRKQKYEVSDEKVIEAHMIAEGDFRVMGAILSTFLSVDEISYQTAKKKYELACKRLGIESK